MAESARSTNRDVIEHHGAINRKPYKFGFFSSLRWLEAIEQNKPRLGDGYRSRDDVIRLGQEPSSAFAPSTLSEYRQSSEAKRGYLSQFFFGLFGPHGPLPLHLTEYVRDRQVNFGDKTPRAFIDIFHHRFTSFFYRAWANSQPVVNFDRPDERKFDDYVGSLVGVAGVKSPDSVQDDVKRFWAGQLSANTRSLDGIQRMLSGYFTVDIKLREFVGEWLTLDAADRFQLGGDAQPLRLGVTTVVGGRVWQCQHRVELICGPLSYDEYVEFLPGGDALSKLKDLTRLYLGDEFAWKCRLLLKKEEAPRFVLGSQGRLGWNSWLGKRSEVTTGSAEHAARVYEDEIGDVVVNPFFAVNR